VLAVMALLAGVAACSGQNKAGAPSAADITSVQFALTTSCLPTCGSSQDGDVYYVWSDSKFYVCHGSTKTWVQTNLNGLNAAVSLTPVSPGSQCKAGGSSIAFGLDLNANGKLDPSEVTSTTVVCNGSNGATGATGAKGATGTTGATGAIGATGAAGPSGPTGPTGSVGATGAMGVTGATGAVGPSGPVGATGATGATGADGANGATGADGATGATGPMGPSGPVGATGTTGATGADGANGVTGPVGPSGPVGATGATGATGADGATGATGADGANGATGPMGPGGPVGATGATGATGTTGATGATGATGVGTTGAPGATGATGATGADGTPGATGATGSDSCSGVTAPVISGVTVSSGPYFAGVPYTVTVTLSSNGGSTNLTYSSIGDDATFTGSGSTQTLTPNAVGGPFNFEAIVSNGCAIAIYPYSIASVSKLPSITAGAYHTCALSTTGTVYCWGDNVEGQLGNNSTTESNVPVQVAGLGGTGLLSGIASIAAGQYHTCALSATGAVYCWGYNDLGQLGNNSTNSHVPVQVEGVGGSGLLSGIASIAAGWDHTCALTATGAVYCWGWNNYGQLGNNSTTESNVPVQVEGVGGSGLLSGIASIAAGELHTCAVSTTGAVYCWGYNDLGQLGNNSTTNSHVPVQVEGVGGSGLLSGIASIAAGELHTCAVSTTGAVYCWGYNYSGQLANNSYTDSHVPVQVEGVGGSGLLSGIASISAGDDHTCALSATGRIDCWGFNGEGNLGNNSTTYSYVPIEVTGF
jgi:alpha-tubulin suppressor-like RCC1 family protein